MIFSDDNENSELIEKHLEKIEEKGVKKYVVSIDNKYVPLIDEMSVEERNEMINDIIAVHNDEVNSQKQAKNVAKILTKIFIFIFILLFAAPGLLWLINQSFTMTKNNYHEMQTHFEVLYKNKKK